MKSLKAQASVFAFLMDTVVIALYFCSVFSRMSDTAANIIWITMVGGSLILSSYSYFNKKHILLSTCVLLLSFLLAALYVAQRFMG